MSIGEISVVMAANVLQAILGKVESLVLYNYRHLCLHQIIQDYYRYSSTVSQYPVRLKIDSLTVFS
jgi:hypothetical protein